MWAPPQAVVILLNGFVESGKNVHEQVDGSNGAVNRPRDRGHETGRSRANAVEQPSIRTKRVALKGW